MKQILVLLFLTLLLKSTSIAKQISKMDSHAVITYTIWAEARNQGEYGMCLVASVIYNRANIANTSERTVCLKRKQFSCWNGKKGVFTINPTGKDLIAWNHASILARDMISKNFAPFTTANHYYNPSLCSPSWGPKMKNSFVYKNHKFGCL